VERDYQDKFTDFTCCVGSGMESHALHGDGIFYESGDHLWINLYAPSAANWENADAKLTVDTDFPDAERVLIRMVLAAPKTLSLSLRRPSWAKVGFTVSVNGEAVDDLPTAGSYLELKRLWHDGDTVTLGLPKCLRMEPLPDNPSRVALLWGPLVLAGDLGPETHGGYTGTPVLVAAGRPVEEWLQPVAGENGQFDSINAGRNIDGTNSVVDVRFTPFYQLHRRSYSAYWDLYTPEEWERKSAEVAAEQDAKRELEAATVAYAQPGEMQPERDFNQQGGDSSPERLFGRPGRRSKSWFSFDMPVDSTFPMALVITYHTDEFVKRSAEILVDGFLIGERKAERMRPGGASGAFFEVEYPLLPELVAEKSKVTVRFQATEGNDTGTVFGLRMVRS
jgi:hypothetical protein